MSTQHHRELGEEAEGQHGLFTRSAAKALGISNTAVTERASAGRYRRILPGVYALSGSPESLRQRIAAAVLSLPALAAVSHQTAAEMWGLTDRRIRTIEVVTPRWDRVHRDDIVVHESLDLIADDVIELDGIPVTSPVRTVVDLGASNRWIVELALEQGIRRDLFDLTEVESFVARVARRGRRGVGVIRPLLEQRRRWDSATDSPLEDRFRKLIGDAGLPAPKCQHTVRDQKGRFICRADFAYLDARLLIELDSEAHHLDRLTFRRDRSKQNQATVLGWTFLRYTWWDLEEDPLRVVAEVRSALGPDS